MTTLHDLVAGALIGMAVAAPIGPMGALCIQRTLADGFRAGIATGLGAATVHLVYSLAIVIGMGMSARRWLETNVEAIGVASAMTLFWFALRAYRGPARLMQIAGPEASRFSRSYLSAVSLGAVNPLTILLLIAGFQAVSGGPMQPGLILGVFIGSLGWWAFLSGAVSKVRAYLDGELLATSNKLASFALAGLGAWTLLRSVLHIPI